MGVSASAEESGSAADDERSGDVALQGPHVSPPTSSKRPTLGPWPAVAMPSPLSPTVLSKCEGPKAKEGASRDGKSRYIKLGM
jgi:hypothetical protein